MDVVVGERSVAPLSLIKLIVELRIPRERIVTLAGGGEKREQEFLMKKKDAEDISLHKTGNAFAHALHWPQTKKPSRWSSWATSRRKGCGATIQGFGLPDVRDAVPGSTKRWVVHTEGVSGQRYVRWERNIPGCCRAYFFGIYSTGLNILIAIHSWELRMCRHWARMLGRALKMRFRNRKRTAWVDGWPSCAVVPSRGKRRVTMRMMTVTHSGGRKSDNSSDSNSD